MTEEFVSMLEALQALYLVAPGPVAAVARSKVSAYLSAVRDEVDKLRVEIDKLDALDGQLRERAEQAELDASRLVSARDLQIRDLSESLDNIRAALGQDETHHLIMADDVKELVDAVEQCGRDGGCRASAVLRRLRER